MFPSHENHHHHCRFLIMAGGCTYSGLAIFRIGFGIGTTMELILRYQYLPAFYSNNDSSGTLPISLLLNQVDTLYQYILCFPYSYCYGDLWHQQVLLGIHVVIQVCITLGVYGSNTLCFISWYLYLVLTLRNTWLSYILDRYIHYLLFLSIFLPHYECWSVHSYLRSNRTTGNTGTNQNRTNTNTINMDGWYISPATIVTKIFLFWIYLDAGYGKFQNTGWSYGADPLPALDTYARHTIIAQYMTTLIGGTPGWRILTPLVVYVELGAVPMTLLGLYMYNPYIVYTSIGLITALHLGIASTIRNATLLSFIAITPWCMLLPMTTTLHRNSSNNKRDVPTVRWSSRSTTIGTLLALIPMIMGCVWFETMSRSCDQSVKHIWSTLLHNRWNVFIGAEEYVTWEIAPGLLADGTFVDIWKDSLVIDWNLPTVQSGGAPSTATSRPGRWRSFPYLAEFAVGSDDYHSLWGYLCREWDAKYAPERRLVQYNFFMLQADVLPDMQFSATRKRLIVSYNCSDAYMYKSPNVILPSRKIIQGSTPEKIAEFPKAADPDPSHQHPEIRTSECRIELTPELDFPKTSITAEVVDTQPELSQADCRIELAPEVDFPKTSTTVEVVDTQPELRQSDCRVELSPEPDFPKTSTTAEVVDAQPELSQSDCRIELSPELDFPKTSTTAEVVDTQPELSQADCRIELSPEPDFPKTSTTLNTMNEPDVEIIDPEIRIELSP